MEAFESFVALALEAEGFVVSSAVKFPVTLRTRRADHVEVQTHGYEVDLVGARADRLVLASVKGYLGSRGVVADQVTGETTSELARRYSLLNRPEVRGKVLKGAAKLYGYRTGQIEMRLYVGKFAGSGAHEEQIRKWARRQRVGAGPIGVLWLEGCRRPRPRGSVAQAVPRRPGSRDDEGPGGRRDAHRGRAGMMLRRRSASSAALAATAQRPR